MLYGIHDACRSRVSFLGCVRASTNRARRPLGLPAGSLPDALVHDDPRTKSDPLVKIDHVVVDERKAADHAARDRLLASMDAMTCVPKSEGARAKLSTSDLNGRLCLARARLRVGSAPVFLGRNEQQADDVRAFRADADGVAQSGRTRPDEIKEILRFRYD